MPTEGRTTHALGNSSGKPYLGSYLSPLINRKSFRLGFPPPLLPPGSCHTVTICLVFCQPIILSPTIATMSAPEAEDNPQTEGSIAKDCAILVDGSVLAAGDALGVDTEIKACLVFSVAPDQSSWIGIVLNIPFADSRQQANQKLGFGARYFCSFLPVVPFVSFFAILTAHPDR